MATTVVKQTEPTSDEFSFVAIRARLAAPIDTHYISVKNIGGRNIPFVNITDLKDILDARVPAWESHVVDTKQIGENICVVVRLLIHTTEGVFSQDGTGLEMLMINGYGDPFSNAYAQAFRRACEGFALGRDLWRKKDHQQASTTAGGTSAVRRTFANSKPAQGRGDASNDGATATQLVLLNRKLVENGINTEAWLADEFADVTDVSQLSKAAASYLITRLVAKSFWTFAEIG